MSQFQDELMALEASLAQSTLVELAELRRASLGGMASAASALVPLRVGEHAPHFSLLDADGNRFDLEDERRNGPILVHFYRGHWCSFCQLELRAFAATQYRFRELGIRLVFLSPDAPDVSQMLRRSLEVDLTFLADPGAQVAGQFGVKVELPLETRTYYSAVGITLPSYDGKASWSLPMPASFLMDQAGKIIFAHQELDYRTRLDPVDLVISLKRLLST